MMKCGCSEFAAPLRTLTDIHDRCEAWDRILPTLTTVADGEWRSVRKCSVCDTLWCAEYPFGEMHGGGPPCLYQIVTDDPANWLKTTEYQTANIRKAGEDANFLESLGPEVGPERCRQDRCERLTISHSVCCRQHHYANIKESQQRR
mgnify:CR=1 FL=1